jgi:uncharacterized protein involved in exopolysaccharide biosynthesis
VVGGHAQLVIHAIARHKLLFGLTWAAVVGMSMGLVVTLPKTYSVQTTIQVSPTEVLGDRGQAAATGKPATYAAETVLSRQNLTDLIRKTDLVEQWPKTRALLPRLKDALWRRLFPRPTPEDQLDALVTLLEKRMWATSEQTTVTIGITFPDPQLALKLVEAAQENFLEARQVAEISTVEDAIRILEERASEAQQGVDRSKKKLAELRKERATRGGRGPSVSAAPAATLDSSTSRRGSQLQLQVEAKQRDLAALNEARQRRIAELQSRLEELRAVYSETHPEVVATRESLEAMRKPSPEIAALELELAPMQSELQQRGLLSDVPLRAKRERPSANAAAGEQAQRERPSAFAGEPFDPLEDRDPEITYAKTELRQVQARYNALRDRIQAARLELDGARAAFKYRYVVIHPAERPRGPVSPKLSLVAIASVIAGLVLAAFAPAFLDLTSRRFVEDWQVEQELGVPLLGTLPDL